MKYIVLVGDGMADRSLKELGSKTPLQAAKIPNMDYIASNGVIGLVQTIPKGMRPGSDVANLSLLGYDPCKYYSGRAPLEAANMGVDLAESDVAFRCNLITRDNDTLLDYSAGHISDEEARRLILFINEKLADEDIVFYPGTSYRHLMVMKNGSSDIRCVPPHDITGQSISTNLPSGEGESRLIKLMNDSYPLLAKHDVNLKRQEDNRNPANMIWLWGQGQKPRIPLFKEKFGKEGSVISAVNLIKGMGIYMGLHVINVPGVTGYIDTNYKGKADYALASLQERDFVFIHVESPDEAGHMKDIELKIKAIEDFDKLVVGTILKGIEKFNQYRILVVPDHATPLCLGTHSSEPVPFAIYGSDVDADKFSSYDEESAKQSSLYLEQGHTLMERFIKGTFKK